MVDVATGERRDKSVIRYMRLEKGARWEVVEMVDVVRWVVEIGKVVSWEIESGE